MRHGEDTLQIACVRWFDYQHAKESWSLFHVPNGGRRNQKEAARFKAMGVRAGVPDLLLLLPRHGYAYLAIELKYGKNTQTQAQKDYERRINANGGLYTVVRGIDGFIALVDWYLKETGKAPPPGVGRHTD